VGAAPRGETALKLSIVTPSYNGVRFLQRAADSILRQTGDVELEWIVVDGGSSDGTVDFLRSLNDPRVRWTSEPDRGQSDAINKGMSRATGDVVAWLNTDDVYTPGALAEVVGAFQSNPDARWLVGRYEVIDEQDRPIRSAVVRYKERSLRRYTYRALLRENFISQPAVFWRRDFGSEIGSLDESLHWTMDYDLWLRMGRVADPRFVDRVLARFRLHPQSKTGKVDRRQFDEQYAVAKRYFGDDRVSRIVHRFNVEKIVWAYRALRLLGR
jgi:glycosyltransferase involved in cell wall biosynthesis